MHKKEFLKLREVVIRLLDETLSSHSYTEQERIFYLLSKKLLNHMNSFYVLLNGTNFNDIIANSEQLDHSSAKILLRASFESYLTIAHLFLNKPKFTDFRILLYKHTGLKERRKLPMDNLSDEVKVKVDEEFKLIKSLEKSIQDMSVNLNLQAKHTSKALKDGWSAGNGWVEIGNQSPLPNSYVKYVYRYLCGYSHSGFESLMQLSEDEGRNNNENKEQQSTLYFYATYLLANFCKSYCNYLELDETKASKYRVEVDMFLNKYQGVYS